MDREADRLVAAGCIGVDQVEAVALDLERRDRVAACVDREQALSVEHQAALVSEPAAGPVAPGGELAIRSTVPFPARSNAFTSLPAALLVIV